MRIRTRAVALSGMAALVAAGIFAAIGIGEGGNGGHSLEVGRENAPVLAAHATKNGAEGAVAAVKRKRPRVSYFESAPIVLDSSSKAATLQCPKRSKAINGYLITDHAGIVLDYSAVSGFTGPLNPRRWSFEAIYAQTNNTTHNFQVGVVCMSGVR